MGRRAYNPPIYQSRWDEGGTHRIPHATVILYDGGRRGAAMPPHVHYWRVGK